MVPLMFREAGVQLDVQRPENVAWIDIKFEKSVLHVIF